MGSFAKHVGEAERIGARVIFRRSARLEMDVDDESDLRALLKNDLSGTETGRWLRESGVESRYLRQIVKAAKFGAGI
jgi:2-phospho-L-lactate guanylyltransferase (CobY/MobA/RfbA family)